MTQEERLEIYKEALWDYQLSNLPIIGYLMSYFLDTDITYEYLVIHFNQNIADGIKLLSIDYTGIPENEKDTYYFKRITVIAEYQQLAPIKMADLEHNTQSTRLKGIEEDDIKRMKKYHQSYLYLKSKLIN